MWQKFRGLFFNSLLFFILLAPFWGCGKKTEISPEKNEAHLKIIGGNDVGADEVIAKTTVALVNVRPNKDESFCSGTLIADNVVLTAGHCVEEIVRPIDIPAESKKACPENFDPIELRVGFGNKSLIGEAIIEDPFESADPRRKYRVNPELKLRKVKKIEMHARYSFNPLGDQGEAERVINDIALVFLAEKAPGDAIVMPILKNRNVLKSGTRVTVAGFGVTYAQMRYYNDGTKCAAPLGIVKYAKGQGTLRKKNINLRSVRSGGADGGAELILDEGTCWGDSGGPTFITVGNQSYVTGVSSRSEGIAAEDDAAFKKIGEGVYKVVQRGCVGNNIYTDASSFTHWINEKLRANIGKTLSQIKIGRVEPLPVEKKTDSTDSSVSGEQDKKVEPTTSSSESSVVVTDGKCPTVIPSSFTCADSSGCAAFANLGKDSIGKLKPGISFDVKKLSCQISTGDIWLQVSSSKGDIWIVSGQKYK